MLGRYRLVDVFILKHLVCGLNEEQLKDTFGDDECEDALSITRRMTG